VVEQRSACARGLVLLVWKDNAENKDRSTGRREKGILLRSNFRLTF